MSISSSIRSAEVEIDEGLGAAVIAAGALGLLVVDLARIGRGDRNRQPANLAGGRFRYVDRLRDRTVGRDVERRAVGHHAGRAAQAELALLGEVAVDFECRKSPRIRCHLPDATFEQVLKITVVLLQMMRPEE